jgi:hypothetical protein
MIKLFKPKKLLLLIDKNEMELIDLLTNKTFRAKSDFDFSKDSLHIAEFSIAEKLLEELITKHFGKRIFRPNLDILVQPILKNNEWLSSVEKRAIVEVCSFRGGRKVIIHESTELITHQKAKNLLV